MSATDPGTAREEAERLVATVLAAARLAASGVGSATGPFGQVSGLVSDLLGQHRPGGSTPGAGGSTPRHAGSAAGPAGGGIATGSAECCVCPVCRTITMLRDPSPEFAERLATGAGDLAAGVASLLRAFSPTTGRTDPDSAAAGAPSGDGDGVWRAAARTGHDSPPAVDQDVWSVATRADGGPEDRPVTEERPMVAPRTARPDAPAGAGLPDDRA